MPSEPEVPVPSPASRLVKWLADRSAAADIAPVLLILLLVAWLSWTGITSKSNTVDEVAHILAGHTYWSLNDYRLAPESGNLASRVAALPLQFQDNDYPVETDGIDWEYSNQWTIARQWWYNSGYNPFSILRSARAGMLAWNLLGLVLVFSVSSRLWGRGGGYFSLILAGFSPNFLGHMPLATSDFAGAWTLLLAVLCYVGLTEKISPMRILLAGLTAGIAVATKQSGIILGPVAICLLAWRIGDGRALPAVFLKKDISLGKRSQIAPSLIAASLLAAAVSYAVLWTAYGWRYTAANPEVGQFLSFQKEWITIHEGGFLSRNLLGFAREWKVLPEAFIYGLDFILARSDRGGFLDGTYSPDGFRTFYIWSFLYKTPLPAIALHLGGAGFMVFSLVRLKLASRPEVRGLVVMAGFYILLLLTTRLNIGYRHAFPLLLVSCIVAAAAFAHSLKVNRHMALALTLVLSTLIPLAWMNANRFIAYVNILGGGTERGYMHVTDSSLDWGQDLPAVAGFIKEEKQENPSVQIYFAAHGTGSLPAHGIEKVNYLPFWGYRKRDAFLPELKGGIYIFSTTAIAYLYEDWPVENETRYIQASKAARELYQRLQAKDGLSVEEAGALLSEEEFGFLEEFEKLRCKRLIFYVRNRNPDKVLAGTNLVYLLGSEELNGLGW